MSKLAISGTSVEKIPHGLREPYITVLEILCSDMDFEKAAKAVLAEISEATGCEATALRIYDGQADYPYYVYLGFEDSFYEKERLLCARDSGGKIEFESDGKPKLECMCGLVISGQVNSELSFITENGSFWTNSSSELLSSDEAKKIQIATRNVCMEFGYESIVLTPLRAGNKIVGLLQANSREKGRFTTQIIDFLERLGTFAGLAIEASWKRRELDRLWKEFEDRRRGAETMIAIGEVAATLAHELKNPLAGIMLSAGRLRKALSEMEGQEKMAAIAQNLVEATSNLEKIVARVAQTDRSPKLETQYVSINSVLESAVSLISAKAAMQDVHLVYDLQHDIPRVTADSNFLMRAFLNLLMNALEAMPEKGILRLSTRLGGNDQVEVAISDSGMGIDAENIESLFKPFSTTKEGSTGLGLAVTKKIIEMHGGSVSLLPDKDGGTRAVVLIPRDGRKRISERLRIL